MQFNILYGKHENLENFPLKNGNLYVTDRGYVFLDAIKNNELKRLCVVDKADWEASANQIGHIKNRTHWSEKARRTVIDTTTQKILISTSDFVTDVNECNFEEILTGKTYIVTFNDIEYEVIAYQYIDDYGEVYKCLGDGRKFSEDQIPGATITHFEDVPFGITQSVSRSATEVFGSQYTNQITIFCDDDNSTVKIEELYDYKTFIPLPEEYIPDSIARVSQLPEIDWQENDTTSINHILNRTHWYGNLIEWITEEAYNDIVNEPQIFGLVEGYHGGYYDYSKYPHSKSNSESTWIIEYDDKTYICPTAVLEGEEEYYFIGNFSLYPYNFISDEINNEIPFLLSYTAGDTGIGLYWHAYWTLYTNDNKPHKIKIGLQLEENGYNQLDARYLPPFQWQARHGENGHIDNRTHYKEPEITYTFKDVDVQKAFSIVHDTLYVDSFPESGSITVILDGVWYENLTSWTQLDSAGDSVDCIGDSRLLLTPVVDDDGNMAYDEDGSLICEPSMKNPIDVPFAIECWAHDGPGNFQWTTEYYFKSSNATKYAKKISVGKPTGNTHFYKLDERYMPDEVATKSYIEEQVNKIIGGKY